MSQQQLMLRLIDEKPTEHEVVNMVWSPKMDILALSFTNGSVSLNRINNWQKIWSAGAVEEGRHCSALAWRPDGKLLAAGDTGGSLTIRHIERSDTVHREQLDSAVLTISWQHTLSDQTNNNKKSKKWEFLAKLPSLKKSYSNSGGLGQEELEDCRKLDSSDTSVLVVATVAGTVYVLINGYLLCMKLSMGEIVPSNRGIKSVTMTPDLKTLSVIVDTEYGGKVIVINCPILSTCKQELLELAEKYCLIHGLMIYTNETIKQIQEAWETILLEMDTKLSEYAKNNPPGTVAADFLELLMFGIPTPQLKTFLKKEMEVKTLKKLGQSMELSYSNIQRLVLSYLGAVSQSLNFQMWEVLGLARLGHKYSVLGVSESLVETALARAQSFWSKGYELQQVIDESMKNFKAFFRWIYVEMLRLDEEPINGEFSKVSQQDITFIAEFLQRFQPLEKESGVSHVYLEKVGQYLKEEDLFQPVDRSDGPWFKLLEDNPDLAACPFIIPHNSKTSLVKEHLLLNTAINDIFSNVGRDLTSQSEVILQQEMTEDVLIDSNRQFVDDSQCHGIVISRHQDSDSLLYWRIEPTNHASYYSRILFDERIIDAIFYYTKDGVIILTVLSESEAGVQTLVQCPVSALTSHLTTTRDTSPPHLSVLDVSSVRTRVIDNLAGCQIDACGYRNVSAILFKNKKRVRIYDMEGEEEDDEEDNFNSSGLSSSQLG